MADNVAVCALIGVTAGCPLTCTVHGSDMATIAFGEQGGDSLELQLDAVALRLLVEVAGQALFDMDERYAQEQAAAPADNGRHALVTGR